MAVSCRSALATWNNCSHPGAFCRLCRKSFFSLLFLILFGLVWFGLFVLLERSIVSCVIVSGRSV